MYGQFPIEPIRFPTAAATHLLRLWELAGQGGQCRVQLPAELKAATAQPVNLRGMPQGKSLAIRGGTLECELKPFAPASFVLNP